MCVCVCMCVCAGKRERYKTEISRHLVYSSNSDVVVSGFFFTVAVEATIFSLGTAAVLSGEEYEFNLQ